MIVWEKGETFESLQKREIQEIVKNMAIYFVNNTENVNNIKLNCLFYFADKMSIKEYVFPISRQDYFAYEYGPSPVSIRNNIINAFNLNDIFIKNSDGFFNTIPGIFFVDGEFCNNDLTILDSIINEFKTITWQEISKKACEKGDCWDIIWDNGKGNGKIIPIAELVEINLSPEEKERRRIIREYSKIGENAFSKLISNINKK